ncbi:MAG: protein kinase [Sinobacteraceae bacterium]|nr:protein kinase [Nevskiaceae bacterium]
MNFEARKASLVEGWSQFEGQLVDGTYPLRRFLGASGHSAVFLTETRAEEFLNAAIKLIPAEGCAAEVQLAQWQTAQSLTHPNLLRLLNCGRCELGGTAFLYVVMEYADETLSQILPIRALDPEEVRELLNPTLQALSYLHRQNLVHGQLRPSNFLVVNDTLKLASDTIRGIGQPAARPKPQTLYDAPEAVDGRIAAAGDIWGLGITMVEALTQYPPATVEERSDVVSLPATVPPTFVYVVRQCLNRNPANRPTVADLEGQVTRAAAAATAAPAAVAAPVMTPRSGAARAATAVQPERARGGMFRVLIVLVALAAGGWLLWQHYSPSSPGDRMPGQPGEEVNAPAPAATAPAVAENTAPAAATKPTPSQAPAISAPSSTPVAHASPSSSTPVPVTPASSPPPAAAALNSSDANGSGVLHEEMPAPSASARDTIHGHIKISVLVTVDARGNVTDAALQEPGPSKYFARLAVTAANKWKFAPGGDSRQWLLHFDFSRDGVSGHATGA